MASEAIARLKATYKRRTGSGSSSTTVFPELMKSPEADDKLHVIRWYDTVISDLTRIDDALKYYHLATENAYQHVTAVGQLTLLQQETPGLQALYGGIHVDASQIRKYMEEILSTRKAKKIKWFMYDPVARREFGEVKITEAKQWTEADDSISDFSLLIRRVANAENQLGNVMNGFTTRSVMLTNISKVRAAGQEEVWVDPTKETNNV